MIGPFLIAGALYGVHRYARRATVLPTPRYVAGCNVDGWPPRLLAAWTGFLADPTGWVKAHVPLYRGGPAVGPSTTIPPDGWTDASFYAALVDVGCTKASQAFLYAWNAVALAGGA